MDKIAVFCSASHTIDPVFAEKAREFGAWLGEHRKWLVYGGSNAGLMEVLARSAKEHGAKIMGVVPEKLEEHGRVSDLPDVVFRTVNLSDRKDIMLQESDIMVALPGGIGTLDEVFHVMASHSIGYHQKKVIFYNVEGFWDGLLALLERLDAARFTHTRLNRCFEVAGTLEELARLLE